MLRGTQWLFECTDGEEGIAKSERAMNDCEARNSMWEVYEKIRAIVALLALS